MKSVSRHSLTILFLWLCMSVVISAQTKARTYNIVASESSFWVYVSKAGLFSAFAHNHEIGVKSFAGRIVIPEAGASAATLEMNAEAKSLAVLDKEVSDKDRVEIYKSMHEIVLESAKYQKITFRSVSVSSVKDNGNNSYSFTLNGDLSLHGVTRRIAIPVTATITAQQLKAVGKYTLQQTDYNIKPYSAAGGTVKVKNEVVINFSIIAK